MKEKYLWLVEYKEVLQKAKAIQQGNMMLNRGAFEDNKGLGEQLIPAGSYGSGMKFAKVAGVIARSDCERFKRLIFRVCRGNSVVIFSNLDPSIDDEVVKSVYVILYQEGESLKNRITKICDAFSKERFDLSDDNLNKEVEIDQKIKETKNLLDATNAERIKILREMVEFENGTHISRVVIKELYIAKEKSLYTNLSKLELENSLHRGLCWCPERQAHLITQLIEEENRAKGSTATFKVINNHKLVPPTYVRINEFNSPFQEVVSTYGIPSYEEVNPAYFAVVTFPFLFGVMFGDVCHGLILFLVGITLCLGKDVIKKSKVMLSAMIDFRFLILFMGIFAVFCGFIYNEFAGLNMNIFPSCYKAIIEIDKSLDVLHKKKCVYQFGMDPFWKYSERELQFENSFKMKFAVIIGVIHMFMGVCLKLVNSIHFKKSLDIFFEFLPQALFLLAMFGYMNTLIFAKWLTNYDENVNNAPVVITAVINMYIGLSKKDNLVFPIQYNLNYVMLGIIGLCIPLMLLPKPLILKYKSKQVEIRDNMASEQLNINRETIVSEQSETSSIFASSMSILQPKEEAFNFSEAFVHQLIETIEYALGTISNTASYLRLWALSLAHAQLSAVFLEYAILGTINLKIPFVSPIIVKLIIIVALCSICDSSRSNLWNSSGNGCA